MNTELQSGSEPVVDLMGSCEPERAVPSWLDRLGTGTILVASCATGLALLGGTCAPCMGATRSARLEWERRQDILDGAASREAPGEKSQTEQQR